MKVRGLSWVGVLTDDYAGTKDFWGKILGLNQEWSSLKKGVTFFRFSSGQEVEVYSSTNRSRKEKYHYFKGPVLGIEVDGLAQAREEIMAQGLEVISEIESTEDGQVSWLYFAGPDGYLYSLHEHFDAKTSSD